VVEQNGRVAGLLTLHEVKKIPRSDWTTTSAAQAMILAEQIKRIRLDAELSNALGEMDRDSVSHLPVMVDDQIRGVLGLDDVISLLRTLSEFSRRQNHLAKRPNV
jgi:CBS domain-containing protein